MDEEYYLLYIRNVAYPGLMVIAEREVLITLCHVRMIL